MGTPAEYSQREFTHAEQAAQLLRLRRELLVRAGRLPALAEAPEESDEAPDWAAAPREPGRRIGRFVLIVLIIAAAMLVKTWLKRELG